MYDGMCLNELTVAVVAGVAVAVLVALVAFSNPVVPSLSIMYPRGPRSDSRNHLFLKDDNFKIINSCNDMDT